MRIAREDELADAERVVLLDAVGDLLVAADERRARAAAHEADARPQVRGDLELVRAALVQRRPCGAGPRTARRASRAWAARDVRGVEAGQQPSGLRPRLLGRVARDDVQADAEAQLAARALRGRADAVELLGDLRGRLAPGEVDVDVAGGDLERGGGGAAEVDRGARRRVGDARALDVDVVAGEVELALPGAAQHGQELARLGVALVLAEEVAVAPLLGVVAADDDVQEQPPARDPLVGGGHLRREHRATGTPAGRRRGTSAARSAG